MRLVFFFFFTFSLIANAQQTKKDCADLYENNDLKEAFECYSFLADSLNDYYQCAKIAGELGDSKSKKTWAKNMLKIFSEYPSTYYLLARLEGFESSSFLKPLKKGLKKFPDDALLLLSEYNYLFSIKEYKKSLIPIDKLIVLEPNNADHYSSRGISLDLLDKKEEAVQSFQKSLKVESSHKEANYSLGLIYYEKALSNVSASNAESDSLSYTVLIKESLINFEKAYPHFEQVYMNDPDDEELVKALLKCYLRLGKMEQYRLLLDDRAK